MRYALAIRWLVPLAMILPAAAVLPMEGKAMVIYVSPQGNDAWSGHLPDPNPARTDGPLRTLERARDALRRTPADSQRRVVLRGGTYRLDRPLVLGPEDSGTRDHPVVWQARVGERVVISGGKRLRNWEARGQGLWAAPLPDLPDGLSWPPIRQMRVDDHMAILARHPNRDPADPLKKGWLFARRQQPLHAGGQRRSPPPGPAYHHRAM